jgi:acyl-CoA thioester hydrolase
MIDKDISVSTRLKVPFHHCDPLSVVWHGHYLAYFEQARAALLAKYGLDVSDIRSMGYRMYVTEAHCHYGYPLSYNDEVAVQAKLTAVTPLVRVAYRVTNLSQSRPSARGYTKLATTDAQGNLLAQTPDDILARLAAAAEQADREAR